MLKCTAAAIYAAISAFAPAQAPSAEAKKALPTLKFERGQEVSLYSGQRNEFEPSMGADGKGGVYVAWKDGQSGSSFIRYSYSHDYGQTWSKDILMPEPNYKYQSDPVVMVGSDGRITVSWIAYNRPGDTAVDMVVSTDRGLTWSTPMKQCAPTHPDAKDFFDREWQVMKGDLVVTSYHVGNRIYVARSKDGGKTVEGVSNPDGKTGGALSAVLTQTPDGVVHTVWLKFGTTATLRYSSSKDGAATWSAPQDIVKLHALDYKGRAFPFGSICSDSIGNVYVAFCEGKGRDGEGDVAGAAYLVRSEDGGKTWTEPMKLCDSEDRANGHKIQPWTYVDEQDRVHAVWFEHQGEKYTVRHTMSLDRGKSFGPNVTAVPPHLIQGQYQSDFISISGDSRYIYVAAPYPVGDAYEIHVMRAPIDGVQSPTPIVRK
jgi:hypothetical protein